MNKTYIQLTSEERDRIAVLRAQGKHLSDIAWILGRNKSTICRELKRNKSPVYGIYLSHKAHERAAKRKYEAALRPRLKDSVIMGYVIKKLRLRWSPEQIAGRIAQELPGQAISHEAIYQFIKMCQNTPQLCCGDEWLKKFVFEISVAVAMNSA
jgi:IS30 family transposase